jgi:para-nitrobenzyl esterase
MRTYRRDFIKTFGAGFIGTGLGLCLPAHLLRSCKSVNDNEIIVNTTYGKLKGNLIDEIGVFKGVPYAGPSEGSNRFLPPTPVVPWDGIKDVTTFIPIKSYQPPDNNPRQPKIMSENCQVINIWAPSIKSRKKVPVMFWCHGGGFTTGSGTTTLIDMFDMAKAGNVVVITVTHRLNAFGYLYLGHLDEKYSKSGNAGMLDIVAALQWVKDNISEFGGDPGNVTIFGQSGGGGKVSTLMAMPIASGLFHKAIVQSGALLKGRSKDDAINTTNALFQNLKIKPGDIDGLLKIPPEIIIEKLSTSNNSPGTSPTVRMGFGPVVDGTVLLNDPFDPVAPALSANIPMIIGTNKDEMGANLTDEKAIMDAIRKQVGDETDKLVAAYKEYYPQYSLSDIYSLFSADVMMRMNSIKMAERKLQQPAPVYMYLFNFGVVPEGGRNPRSAHSMELSFVFNHPGMAMKSDPGYRSNFNISPGEEVNLLGRNMSLAWSSFAYDGNPDHAGLPHWPVYNLKERSTLIFDLQCKVENDPGRKIREIFSVLK